MRVHLLCSLYFHCVYLPRCVQHQISGCFVGNMVHPWLVWGVQEPRSTVHAVGVQFRYYIWQSKLVEVILLQSKRKRTKKAGVMNNGMHLGKMISNSEEKHEMCIRIRVWAKVAHLKPEDSFRASPKDRGPHADDTWVHFHEIAERRQYHHRRQQAAVTISNERPFISSIATTTTAA